MASMLQWAQRYRAYGYHPLPVAPGTKRPMVDWKPYQVSPPSDEDIVAWWTRTPSAGVALVMGRGMFAVDIDGGDVAERMLNDAGVVLPADAPRSRTGGGGYHILLRGTVPDACALLKHEDREHCQVDIKGKGIIVVAPTIHPNGTAYVWDTPPAEPSLLPEAPAALLAMIQTVDASEPVPRPVVGESWVETALCGVGQGQRADLCTKLAGYFLGRGIPRSIVTTMLIEGFARRCTPPFPADEVRTTVANIAKREATTQHAPATVMPVHVADVMRELEAQRVQGPPPAVPTGFEAADWMLSGGFHPGELVYIGARPAVGKTALAMQIAGQAARAGHPVVVVSREMLNVPLARRMMSQETGILAHILRRGVLTPACLLDYEAAVERVSNYPLWMTDQAVSITDVCDMVGACASLTVSTGKVGLLVVDYLQLIRAPLGIKERRLQVESVSQSLKTLALQYQIPVLCLSSLSRPLQTAPDAKPTLASLRESGELEHDADVVMFLHRLFKARETTLIVAKNREGHSGEIQLDFNADTLTFRAVETRDTP